jgi:hypothetical protein
MLFFKFALAVGITALVALFVVLVMGGRSAWAEHEIVSLARTASEHVSVCERLGSPSGSTGHAGCLRELGALKLLHDKWSSENAQSFL